jgi:hypothetical protein
MDRKTAALAGAAAAALAVSPAAAMAGPSSGPVPAATSYAELLQPIPNAVERLQQADAEAPPQLIKAQVVVGVPHHHHHHHHHYNRAWYLRNGYYWLGGRWVLRPRHHHHHHHHNYNYNHNHY